MYENNGLYAGNQQMTATEMGPPVPPCLMAFDRLRELQDETLGLLNGLSARLDVVLRPLSPRNETSKPVAPGESPMHDALLQAAGRQEILLGALRELHQRITV